MVFRSCKLRPYTHNFKPGWKRLPRAKHCSLCGSLVNYSCRNSYNIGPAVVIHEASHEFFTFNFLFVVTCLNSWTFNLALRHHDTKLNDTQHNDTQHNDDQHNDDQHNYDQHNDDQHNDDQHNDDQHNHDQHNNDQHNDN